MTCHEALTIMLAADLAELSQTHPGQLGQHLAGCARCARVAEQLRGDTAHLAGAVAVPAGVAVPGRRAHWPPMLAGAVAVAAVAAVFIAARPASDGERPVAPASKPAPTAAVAVQPLLLPPAEIEAIPGPPRTRQEPGAPTHIPAKASMAVAFAPPVPVAAVAFEPPTPVYAVALQAIPVLARNADLSREDRLVLSPHPGVRVMPSTDPDVTVLWFH